MTRWEALKSIIQYEFWCLTNSCCQLAERARYSAVETGRKNGLAHPAIVMFSTRDPALINPTVVWCTAVLCWAGLPPPAVETF